MLRVYLVRFVQNEEHKKFSIMSNLKEKVRLQEEMICHFLKMVTNLEKEKFDLSEEVKRKEIVVHELKREHQ